MAVREVEVAKRVTRAILICRGKPPISYLLAGSLEAIGASFLIPIDLLLLSKIVAFHICVATQLPPRARGDGTRNINSFTAWPRRH